MGNPVLVEVARGPWIESRHRGAVAVVDAEGSAVLTLGDVERPVLPRSAVKALQVMPLVESGLADKFGLTDAEIALACASHMGEPAHAETAAAMLARVGRDAGCLECGVHAPLSPKAAASLAEQGRAPSALHNNCSGKHAGFVCLACGSGDDPAGYVRADHPVQKAVRAALEEFTGATHAPEAAATDGCSIPTYGVPLTALAYGFARFGTGAHLPGDHGKAAQRVRRAVAAHPFMVSGTDQFDTVLMQALGERAFVKVGAEGVYCAALPDAGLGIALKCDDGARRAAEVAMAALIRRFVSLSEVERGVVDTLLHPEMRNWNGMRVGELRPAGVLAADEARAGRRVELAG